MNYRSVSDMNSTIVKNMHRLPSNLDLVVGVPHNGLLAATLLALLGNIRLSDLDSYIEGRVYTSGITKKAGMRDILPGRRRVLVLDDSINSGGAMANARQRVSEAGHNDEILFAAVYGSQPDHPEADLVFEAAPWPQVFQWNFMHHEILADSCVDIDGVLCHDPREDENDDGSAYIAFLTAARPLYGISRPIGTLVTSRLEKYRPQTEHWLAEKGIVYDKLVMLDLPNKAERQRLGAHGSFKADYYRSSDAVLFIESENCQARVIAQRAEKPVLCLETHSLIDPSTEAILLNLPQATSSDRGASLMKQVARSILGTHRYSDLKHRTRR